MDLRRNLELKGGKWNSGHKAPQQLPMATEAGRKGTEWRTGKFGSADNTLSPQEGRGPKYVYKGPLWIERSALFPLS